MQAMPSAAFSRRDHPKLEMEHISETCAFYESAAWIAEATKLRPAKRTVLEVLCLSGYMYMSYESAQ